MKDFENTNPVQGSGSREGQQQATQQQQRIRVPRTTKVPRDAAKENTTLTTTALFVRPPIRRAAPYHEHSSAVLDLLGWRCGCLSGFN